MWPDCWAGRCWIFHAEESEESETREDQTGTAQVSGSRITQAEAELAQAGRTANHEPPEAMPRKRNREEWGEPVHSSEGGGVEKARQPAEMGALLQALELCCNSTVRPKSILSPGCSQHFPLSGVSVPPTCQPNFSFLQSDC